MPKNSVTFKLSVLSISISSTLILSSALAAGGSPGADGQNVAYGGYSQSAASAGGDGSNGLDIAQHNLSNNDINTQASTPGGDSTSANGGGDGGGQIGGQGGGSVFGGASIGGAGGSNNFTPSTSITTNGGNGGAVSDNTITLTNVTLTGASGGGGSPGGLNGGGGGGGGQGGGSIFGGFSNGGAAGYSGFAISHSVYANGGSGGTVSGNTITLKGVILLGETGGRGQIGGSASKSGVGGQGGGSIFGGLSNGGVAGRTATSVGASSANGGNGGAISGNTITLTNVTLTGANGGTGSEGGQGGGSVFGGASIGGRGGLSYSDVSNTFASGGNGGAISGNTITLTDVTLTGADGGAGDSGTINGGANGGQGGGSVFGGLSNGGAGGRSRSIASSISTASGGDGGAVSGNTITLKNVILIGGTGGAGGTGGPNAGSGFGNGSDGLEGGSVFGGLSNGGAGGYSIVASSGSPSANGGNGGTVSGNAITLSGKSSLTGDIYGGYSRGGTAGQTSDNGGSTQNPGTTGSGGLVENNTVTLIGADLTIGGSVYGGYSVDGDGTVHNTRAFTGNTLNLIGYRGSLVGIYNFEKYNWVLPKDVVNNDTLIKITGSDKVSLYDTQHTVALENDGNRLNAGDTVTLIDKAGGSTALTTLTNKEVKQGHFIVYDASLSTSTGALVLRIDGKQDNTPAGRINPTSKAFLEGRAASLAFNNQGADLVSDYGINSAHFSLKQLKKDGSDLNLTPFLAVNGGSSRYSTGSHIDVRGSNMIFGVATGLEFKDQSAMTLGLFVEHGDGSYDSYNSYNSFSNDGSVHGKGNVRYTGGGALFHINVAGTSRNKATASTAGTLEGLYLEGSVRTGNADMSFDSNDLTDAEGVRGRYNSKSKYYGAHGSVGYVLELDKKQSLEVYSRYTWTKQEGDKVSIGKDKLNLNASESSRLRLGARYSYAYTPRIKPYVGTAYEHEFKGDVSGSAYDLSIEKPSLSGNAGIFEVGVSMNPLASNEALSIDLGLQGYVGDREGGAATIKAKYAF